MFYCSSTYWVQAIVFRPLIGFIIARGINNMILSLSGTHILNDQKVLLLPKITSPKEQYQHLKKGSKNFIWQSKTITPRRMVSSAFSWWDFGEVEREEVEDKEKKISVQLLWPWSDLEVLSIGCEGTFEWSSGRKGESELLILITQAHDSLLCVW